MTTTAAIVEATYWRLVAELAGVLDDIAATQQRLRACEERLTFAIRTENVRRARRLHRRHEWLRRRFRALAIRRDNLEDNIANLSNPQRHED